MSSLVAYDDSETEDDSLDQKQEETTGVRTQNEDAGMHIFSEVTPHPRSSLLEPQSSLFEGGNFTNSENYCIQQQSSFSGERKYCSEKKAQEKHFKVHAAPPSSPAAQGKISSSLPQMPRSFGGGLQPAKRHQTLPTGVRPYIPKRQRLTTSVETAHPESPADQVQGNQTTESQVLLEVSARVKPYLSHKPGAAGIPRRLLMSLGGHQGPVNTVQWCPVPHISHLLLSASMDKTFKVTIHK